MDELKGILATLLKMLATPLKISWTNFNPCWLRLPNYILLDKSFVKVPSFVTRHPYTTCLECMNVYSALYTV